MRKLLTVLFLFTLLVPTKLFADTTPSAITETGITENEGVEETGILATLRESFPEIVAGISVTGLGTVLLLAKAFLASNKNFTLRTQGLVDNAKLIKGTAKEVHEAYELIKTLRDQNSLLDKKIDKLEKGEEYLGKILKDFVKATNIRVDDKINLAGLFDEFDKFLSQATEEQKKEANPVLEEFKETINEKVAEDIKKTDEYLEMLKAMSEDDTEV